MELTKLTDEEKNYIKVLEAIIEKDTKEIDNLKATINRLMSYKIKSTLSNNYLRKRIKELEDGNK